MSLGGSSFSMPGGVEFSDTAHLEKLNLHKAVASCTACSMHQVWRLLQLWHPIHRKTNTK